MLTYAIGDIHGEFFSLVNLLKLIEEDKTQQIGNDPARIIFLGDYVDRGLKSKSVVSTLMSEPLKSHNFEQITLKGNHESMMIDALENNRRGLIPPRTIWLGNGGVTTLNSYNDVIPKSHYEFLKSLRTYFIDGEWIFVHGGVSLTTPIEEQSEDVLLWARMTETSAPDYNYRIVHGHTPHRTPKVYPLRINVDTGAFMNRPLTAVVIDTALPKEQDVRFLQF